MRMQGSRRARIVLASFLLTFMAARVLVYLIMARRLPDLFVHVGGTHIHHFNFGILLLCGVGAYLLFADGSDRRRGQMAILYGIGLALTFDEFGMWLHLGGGYWQRASWDAMCVLGGVLALIAAAPQLANFQRRHWVMTFVLAALLVCFGVLLAQSIKTAQQRIAPQLRHLEENAPP
jgi:hypothetical protein